METWNAKIKPGNIEVGKTAVEALSDIWSVSDFDFFSTSITLRKTKG